MNNPPTLRPLLILDLDECLVHASERRLHRDEDFRVGQYYVYRRPRLVEFLAGLADAFELAIWSSGTHSYVNEIVTQIEPRGEFWRFIWSRERCTQGIDAETHELVYRKNLKKVKRLGFDMKRMLIVDDTPEKLSLNYGNAVYVTPYVGQDDDRELPSLLEYLLAIQDEHDYRSVEKRGWRSKVNLKS